MTSERQDPAARLAREQKEQEALAVTCLVCEGKRWIVAGATTSDRYPKRCPGCRGVGTQLVRDE